MKVVIIEDDPDIVEAVSLCFDLRWPDVEIVSANEGIAGLDLIEKESPDITILDVGLPDIDGFEVCRRIRLFSDVPVIMLTVKYQEFDKVKGLELGADDYITKPFSHVELLARVKAVLRRSPMPQLEEEGEPLIVNNLRIDYACHEVRVDGAKVKLTPMEYRLLHSMARNVGKVIPHSVLAEKVWGGNYVNSNDYLRVYIQRLRGKLRDDPQNSKLIVSERGVGYKLSKQRD